ncbi:cryptochrome/photolyase family protein [Lysobacter korlensis]|uniref:Cryptochrome/photolyase family protein n=1 Tax=Lysobacter korlensis TaxID=553636 RepID=A0ABV6RSS7_9GAMM
MHAADDAARTTLVWLRDDLRITDNPALAAATDRGGPVVVVFVLDDDSAEVRPIGSASRWWLHHSLTSLAERLAELGTPLVLRRGGAERVIQELVAETGAGAVLWNRRYSAAREIDARLKTRLREDGVEAESFAANLLFEPHTVTNGSGEPYRVYTPFWRACRQRDVRPLAPTPARLSAPPDPVPSDLLGSWQLLPTAPDWAGGIRDTWSPGEPDALIALNDFVDETLVDYGLRDQPSRSVTSRLSPRLRFGEVSPVQVWHRITSAVPGADATVADKFLGELGWREFNWHVLYSFPQLAERNIRSEFDRFPWQSESEAGAEIEAWRHGRTGIPLVDAGMRELWRTGYMHNRVRLAAASFLVKNLLVDWRVGERWFWDTLVDADEANNPGNWQWIAGSGMDAAPYFRIFNPVLQAQKFDPERRYIRTWVPEVDSADYPEPVVDLALSRRRALAAYESTKAGGAAGGPGRAPR